MNEGPHKPLTIEPNFKGGVNFSRVEIPVCPPPPELIPEGRVG